MEFGVMAGMLVGVGFHDVIAIVENEFKCGDSSTLCIRECDGAFEAVRLLVEALGASNVVIVAVASPSSTLTRDAIVRWMCESGFISFSGFNTDCLLVVHNDRDKGRALSEVGSLFAFVDAREHSLRNVYNWNTGALCILYNPQQWEGDYGFHTWADIIQHVLREGVASTSEAVPADSSCTKS
jgi:hypothetical protein